MYWTDYVQDAINRANLSTGLGMESVVTEHLPEPGAYIREKQCMKQP